MLHTHMLTFERHGDRLEVYTNDPKILKSVWIEVAPGQMVRESELERMTRPE